MRYVLGLYIIGYIVDIMSEAVSARTGVQVDLYAQYLMLDIDKLLQGQVWRLVTFLIQPPNVSLIFLIFFLYLYYMIGESLENTWGSFMFNIYFFSGVLFNILAVVIIYVVSKATLGYGVSYMISLDYINQSLFLAFAFLYPEVQLLLFFFIPIKIKWLGYLEIILLSYNVISGIREAIINQSWLYASVSIAVVVAMMNFVIFYFVFKRHLFNPSMLRSRARFRRNMETAQRETGQARGFTTIARHKCAICGRTEKDDETLEFRYCTKCVGNYEYCMEHLYTHTHVGNMVNLNKSNDGD